MFWFSSLLHAYLSLVSSKSIWSIKLYNHRCIVWCKQLTLALNRILFDLIDTESKQLSDDKEKILKVFNYHLMQRTAGKRYRPDLHPTVLYLKPQSFSQIWCNFFWNSVERLNFLLFQQSTLTKLEVSRRGFYCTLGLLHMLHTKYLSKTLEIIFLELFLPVWEFKRVFREKISKYGKNQENGSNKVLCTPSTKFLTKTGIGETFLNGNTHLSIKRQVMKFTFSLGTIWTMEISGILIWFLQNNFH